MVRRKLSPIRKAQKKLLKGWGSAAGVISHGSDKATDVLRDLDKKHGVTDAVRENGKRAAKTARKLDNDYGVTDKAVVAGKVVSDGVRGIAKVADSVAEDTGFYNAARTVTDATSAVLKQYGLDRRLEQIGRHCENLYGSSRSVIKPYFLPETPDELLRNSRKELAYISACIMQISHGEAEQLAGQFGKVIASKITGIATTGAFLSLVSAFGTAGTGTAIASLSGAASTSATLAWIGGLLGGGMATGAVLTGGVTLIVGLSAYKALTSEKREFDSLDENEQRVVQYCLMLIAIIDDYLKSAEQQFSAGQARTLLNDTLIPLQKMLAEHQAGICVNLDKKNTAAFRQHVLRDFEPVVINPFKAFVVDELADRTLHYEYVIGGVVYALLTRSVVDNSMESQLVLVAIRRSDSDLANASESEITSKLASYGEEQLKGVVNNVKGIYHEVSWVEQYNASHTDTRAELYEATNHPGADVRIVDVESGEVVAEYQLKATANVAYVEEHQVRYTDVEVIATDEVAGRMDDVTASGNRNEDLTAVTEDNIDALANNTVTDRALESAGIAVTIATGQELVEVLQGRKEFPEAVRESIKKSGTAGAATAIAAYFFS